MTNGIYKCYIWFIKEKKNKNEAGSFISRLSDRAVTHLIWREIEA